MRNTVAGLSGLILLGMSSLHAGGTASPRTPPHFMVGVDNAGEKCKGELSNYQPPFTVDAWWQGLDLLGVEFISYHSWDNSWQLKGLPFQLKHAEDLCAAMEKREMKLLLNLEIANWRENQVDPSGFNWVKQANGAQGFNFKREVLDVFVQSPAFLGIIYDEAGHMLINRNRFILKGAKGDVPFLVETTGAGSVEAAHDLFVAAATDYVEEYKKAGVQYVISEHPFPIMHPFAEAGFTVAPKLLKESWAPIMMAIGIGAALQYDQELWVCPDLWDATVKGYPKTFPGHSPEELKSALCFAYGMGADKIYVENYNFKDCLVELSATEVKLTPSGEALAWFTKEYVPQHDRDYTFRDIKPAVAIIRMEDTDFGLANNFWKDQLYGAKDLHSNSTTKNWMKIWHLLTHEVVPPQALDWNAEHIYKPIGPHIFFAPLNNVVVFDHTVSKKHLETVELAFLTGVTISKETLMAVNERVSEGMIAIADPALVSNALKKKYTGQTTVVNQGDGKWILTADVFDPEVRETITPFLGNPHEIRYVFGDQEVVFKGEVGSNHIDVNRP